MKSSTNKRSQVILKCKTPIPVELQDERTQIIRALIEAFSFVSFEEAVSAYSQSNGDPNKAAEILGRFPDYIPNRSSSRSGFYSFEDESNRMKPSRAVASAGTVSTVLGKGYVVSRTTRGDSLKQKGSGYYHGPMSKDDMEQFFCSLIGDESDLSMAVVRDVLCSCAYDVEKTLYVVLQLCYSSYGDSENGSCNHNAINKKNAEYSQSLDGLSDSTSHSSESELQDNGKSMGYGSRNYAEVHASSEPCSLTVSGSLDSDRSQKVLESLFNVSKSSERDPNTMSWRNVVKKMESLGHGINTCPCDIAQSLQKTYAKGDEYQIFRKDAKEHWESMRAFYRRAATAYSNGNHQSAGYLSDQAKLYSKMAREADEKASKGIFRARNKSIENVITIDLHGQHVEQAMDLLKAHLIFGACVNSIQFLKVITGCGTHGVGKSKLKQSVVNLVEKEGIQWREDSPGSVVIKLEGHTELSFMDADVDSV